ncbi:MAG TPA: hypothetical protein VGC01_08725 [Mucilaginibacter sp.]
MVSVKKEGVLLRQSDHEFENEGVLNPAVIRDGDDIHLFYRAVRQGNYSSIGYCKLSDPLTVATCSNQPALAPQMDYELHGMEDPRVVKIDDLFYLSYIAYDGKDALGAYATSADLMNWERKGIIVPQIPYADFARLIKSNPDISDSYANNYDIVNTVVMDKDLVFFPRRINGKLTFLHRIKPGIQITAVNSLQELTKEFWEDYIRHLDENTVISPKYAHEIRYIGGGCPPIETEHGWLVIYHGVKDAAVKGFEYSACAALLDLDDPRKEITRLPYPLFKPEEEYELTGDVDDVVFPTGTALFDDTLYIYYGAADDIIATASVSISALLAELLVHTK